jgi:ligand-binding SRPBCC domain-containing protein
VAAHLLERSQRITGDPSEIFEFFADAHNLEEITPPWLHFRTIEAPGRVSVGARIEYRLRLHGLPVRWVSRIEDWDPPHRFADAQVSGPYRHWHHTHTVEPDGDAVVMRDRVHYSLPFGPLGELAHGVIVRRDLRRIFDYRREAIDRRFGSTSGAIVDSHDG